MTQFFYGATLDDALLMARRGGILSPIMVERTWLQETKERDRDYYEELVTDKDFENVAYQMAIADAANPKDVDKIILTHSVSRALLRLAKAHGPKIVLGIEINHPRAEFVQLPGPIYLDRLTDVRLYEEAVERKEDIVNAFKPYTQKFYAVRKK